MDQSEVQILVIAGLLITLAYTIRWGVKKAKHVKQLEGQLERLQTDVTTLKEKWNTSSVSRRSR